MKKFLLTFSLVLAVQAHAATLECSVSEPKFNQDVERAIDSGAEVSLFESFAKAKATNAFGYAKVKLSAPRSNTEVEATLFRKKLSYTIKIDGKVVARNKASGGFMTGFRAKYSNFHIDASDAFNADISVACQVK